MNRRVNTHNKSIKPWFDKNEWKHVYELLFQSEDFLSQVTQEKTRQAFLHLNVWKSRVDLLPSAIEGTIIILEALRRHNANYTDTQLREAHSFTILRFLNICVASRTKQGNFKATAISQNIPSWIIEIRNDISHDQKLPSLICLEVALRTCFQWLKTHYWDAEYAAKKDFIPKPIDTSKVEALIQIYFIILTPDYNYQEIVDNLKQLGVDAQLTRRNLKEVILGEIEQSLPIPDDNVKTLCKIIIKTFLARYLSDKASTEKTTANKLDEIIIFLYDNKMLFVFIEFLLNLSRRYYPEYVLYFFSKVLDRIFTSLHYQTTKLRQASKIKFESPNNIQFTELYRLYEFEIFKPTPNDYSSTYMESFSKLLNHNKHCISCIIPAITIELRTAFKLDTQFHSKDVIHDYTNIFEEPKDIRMEVDKNDLENYSVNSNDNGKIWNIVEDTSIFQKCALGDYPTSFLETAADALYNYIK